MKRHAAPSDPLLTVADVAERLQLTISGAWKWLRAHDVEMTRPGRKLYVRESELDAVLARHVTGGVLRAAASHLRRVG